MLRALAMALVAAGALLAGEHHGQVRFGGLPVPGATVTASQRDERLVAITGEQGEYFFPELAEGTWSIQVNMLCFAPEKREITVAAGVAAATWDLIMLPLAQLTANAPPPASVAAVKAFQKTELKASGDAPKSQPEAPAPAPADLNQTATDVFAINGSVNNGAASPFGQSGAFGNNRNAGRSLYNVAAGIILDNSTLDARAFSLTGQDTPKPASNRLRGIASFGGPLRIPRLFNANNAPNIFVVYQLVRNRNASVQSGLVPTLQQRTGDLSASAIPALDPLTGVPFPGNMIPANRISSQARALLQYYPLPNFNATARYNYQVPLVDSTDQDSLQTRVNKSINNRNQVYGNFAWQRVDTASPNLFGFRDALATEGLNTAANWQHRFGQRLFAHIQLQVSRLSTRSKPYFANRVNVSGAAGITGNLQDAANWGPPQLGFASGIAGLSDAQAAFNRNLTSAIAYDMLWNKRSHNVTVGADYKRLQFNSLGQANPRGAFTFTGAAAQNDFAGFLLGVPDTSSIAFGNADKYFRSAIYDGYFTDDWRVGPALTLNLGGRWEYTSPITELYGRLVNLDIAPGFAAVAPVISAHAQGQLTSRTYPDSLVHPDKSGLQPRVGLSWRPMADSSMVVRAGYGLYRDTSVYQSIATQMAQQSPLSKSFTVQNSLADPLTLANGFNASPAITPNTFAVDPNFRVGYAHNWQLSVQRDLPGSLVMTATYLGIKGTRAQQEFLPNTFPAGAANPCPVCPTGYAYLTSNGNSTRESGSLQLRRRLHNGFTASVEYTYSKSIDDAALGGRGQGSTVIAQNWLDLAAERGLSPFDQRHLLNVQMQYSSGVGVRGGTLMSGWRGALLKEWTFTSQITAGSGLPETPVYLAAVAGTGVTGSIRPNYTGASLDRAPPGLFLNPAAYSAPLAGQWGDAGRNSIEGPNQFAVNASLGRTFRLTDKLNTDFRLDSTNALNHVTYTTWNTSITNAQFGLPNGANAMRIVQATVRLRF